MAVEAAPLPVTEEPIPAVLPTAVASDAFLSPSLYVGDLHQDVTEAVLFEKFSTAGQISSIRVCRDAVTRRSLGYAYVNYHNPRDADRALDTMNFETLNGYPMRIMWSQRDPAVRRSGAGNVFIKNLAPSIDNKSLFDTFSQFGNILSAKVACDQVTGESRGYGFVHFQTQQDAEKAISMVNGMMMENQKVYVAKFLPRNQRQEFVKLFTNVFVKNLKADVNDEQLRALFAPFGGISSAVVKPTEKTTGFGFVNFLEAASAEAAVAALNGKDQGEGAEALYVARAQKKQERVMVLKQQFDGHKKTLDSKYQGVNLFVKNIDENITDAEFRGLFTDFGVITSAIVMRDDKTKMSKGFGFVCFSAPEEATRAVTEMNGKLTRKRPLYVALHIRKADRLQQLTLQRQQYRQPMGMPMAAMQNMYAPQGQMYYPNYYQPQPNRGFNNGPQNQRRPPFPVQVPNQMGMPPYRQVPNMLPNNIRGGMPTNNPRNPRVFAKQPQAQFAQNVGPNPSQLYNNPIRVPVNRAPQHVLVNQNVRNPSMPSQGLEAKSVPRQAITQDALLMEGQAPLTAAALANADVPAQKQMLGERLYPVLVASYGPTAAKITGMLLEMDNSELLHLLEDPTALSEKAKEAVQVLNESMAPGPQ